MLENIREGHDSSPQDREGYSDPTEFPHASLIICSRNRPKFLCDVVQSVLQGNDLPSEIIIIDDSDFRNSLLSILPTNAPCDIRYTWTHSLGLSRANNEGIATARHDILVFTQDDVLVTPTWFGAIVRALVDAGRHSVVTGQVLPGKAENPSGFAPSTISGEARVIYEGRVGKDVLFLQNMAMYRSASDDLGGFDERLGPGTAFPAAEDNDFGLRLLETGYRIVFLPQAIVYHRAWRTEADYLPLRWSYGRAQGAFFAKHLSIKDRYILRRMSEAIKRHLISFFSRVWRQRRLAYADAVYLAGFLSAIAQWLFMHGTNRKYGAQLESTGPPRSTTQISLSEVAQCTVPSHSVGKKRPLVVEDAVEKKLI